MNIDQLNKMMHNLDNCENNVLACKKEFEDIINHALDAYNDKKINKDMMEDMVKISQRQLVETNKTLEEVKTLRKEIMKQKDEL